MSRAGRSRVAAILPVCRAAAAVLAAGSLAVVSLTVRPIAAAPLAAASLDAALPATALRAAAVPLPPIMAVAAADVAGPFTPGWRQHGRISYYGQRFASKPTASGERFDPEAMTMAHPALPFGSIVRVKNLHNGRSVELRVNDRGPHVKGRIADVSRAAARELGMLRRGVARAHIELLRVGDGSQAVDAAPE